MLKYLMMAGVVAAALTAGSPAAFAKNGSTFFDNQPSTCHRELSDLGVVDAIWVGCNFKWWGGAFEPGNTNGGLGNILSVSREENCNPCPPPPRCDRGEPVKYAKSFNGKPSFKSFGGKPNFKSFGGKPNFKSFKSGNNWKSKNN